MHNPFDSSGEDFDPGFVDDQAQMFMNNQTAGGQQGDARDLYQGGGEDNGDMPSGIAAEQSPSPARSRPDGSDDGNFTGRANANTGATGLPSSSNVTNQQFEEPAFRDQYSGYGEGTDRQERAQTYFGPGAGPESEC